MFDSVRIGSRQKPQAVVLAHFQGEGLDGASSSLDPGGAGAAALKRDKATGELGKVTEAFGDGGEGPGRVLVVGLGKKGEASLESFRSAMASLGRRLAQIPDQAVKFELGGALEAAGIDSERAGVAVGDTMGLLSWNCDEFRGKGTPDKPRPKLTLLADDKAFASGMKRGLAVSESVNYARTLSQTPPNICTPMHMAAEAKKLARETGMSCRVVRGDQLKQERLTGIATVGRASEHEPCLIRLEYKPEKVKKGATPAVLIGKTITYDSGGLSLKINNSMKGMKRDKDGGCAVIGAMHAIATVIKPDRPVVALLAAAENAISDVAYRPDDILEFRNGVTVEVTNTDAEGRLVMADALCWAADKEKPGFIVDMATLTGGVVVALGRVHAGLWCDDDELRGRLECAAEGSGERLWRLPHHREYREMMKSPVADIVNSAPVREAHPIQGAAFLSYFAPEGVPWAHIDLAGPHVVDKDTGPFIAGPTGFGVRLMAELFSVG